MDSKVTKDFRQKVRRSLDVMSPDQLDVFIGEILTEPLPMATVLLFEREFLPHDDCDGDKTQGLMVAQDAQGDMWLSTVAARVLRFRTTGGGTRYPHVHNALRILALAMILDKKD